MRERQRVRRLFLRRKIENWIGTIVVVVLAACAVAALMNTKLMLSDNPATNQGFRKR